MKKVLIGVLLAAMLITAGSFTALAVKDNQKDKQNYFKFEQNGYSIDFPEPNERQLKMIEKLYGKDITLGEYIEKVYPEILNDIPKNVKKKLYSSKVVWPSEKLIKEKSFASANKKSEKVVLQEYIFLTYASEMYLDPGWPYIKHRAWTYEVWPLIGKILLPFMADESYLWYKA